MRPGNAAEFWSRLEEALSKPLPQGLIDFHRRVAVSERCVKLDLDVFLGIVVIFNCILPRFNLWANK